MKKKKKGALPLAIFLSFNDKDVHPDCPNASNPYHKCARQCLHKIPSANNFLQLVPTSDGDRHWENKSEKRGVRLNPNCPNASNPYHQCAEYCSEKLSNKGQDAGKYQPDIIAGMKPEEEKKAVFATERGVKPACKNASNSYHVCAEYCFQNVLERDQPGQVMRLKGSKEGKKILSNKDRTGSHPRCKHASNPNHECTESCFQSVSDRNLAEGENTEGVSIKTEKSCVLQNHKNASSPYRKDIEYSFEDNPEKEHHEGAVKPKEQSEIVVTVKLNLECKNASNPSYVCAEYCSESVPDRDKHEQVIRVKSKKEGDMLLNNRQRTGLDPRCKYASNPHHECNEFCFQNNPDSNLTEGENSEGVSMKTDKYVHSGRKNASSPYHKVNEYYFEDTSEKEHPEGAIKPTEESEIVVVAEQGVNLECKNASNPHHVRAEYRFRSVLEREKSGQGMKPKEERIVVAAHRGVNLECKNESNPYHVCAEYCFQNLKDQRGKALVKSKENKKAVVPLERGVTPQIKNAAEYKFQNDVHNEHHPGRAIEKLKEEEVVVLPSERRVSRECKFASNPYHVCAEYCFQNAPESEQRRQVMKLKSAKELKNSVSNKKITNGHAQCKYATNPYHKCAEYCFNQNIPGRKMPDGVMKTNDRKKENNYALRRDVNPKCKNASNPFHRCPEYCSEAISPKNEAVEGITATVKEKKRNSSKENKRNHPILEKISLNCENKEASKPSHNYIESSEGIISQDGTEKSNRDSKYVEALNPTNNNFNLNNGISMYMRDGTKDLQLVAKVVEKELPTDASDLFNEWAKYCSQTKAADDEIVEQEKKVGMGEFSITKTNGKGNNGPLNDYDSANMDKVQANNGGLPRSLPISLLLFIGFLLAPLYWTQVIDSLVMSSEKNEGGERLTHEGHLDPNCTRKVSDPSHKCSQYCFRGVGEELY